MISWTLAKISKLHIIQLSYHNVTFVLIGTTQSWLDEHPQVSDLHITSSLSQYYVCENSDKKHKVTTWKLRSSRTCMSPAPLSQCYKGACFAHHKVTSWTPANYQTYVSSAPSITMLQMWKLVQQKVASWTPANLRLACHQLHITILQMCKFAQHRATSWTPAIFKVTYDQLSFDNVTFALIRTTQSDKLNTRTISELQITSSLSQFYIFATLAHHKVTSWTPANLRLAFHQLPVIILHRWKFAHHKLTSWTRAILKVACQPAPCHRVTNLKIRISQN